MQTGQVIPLVARHVATTVPNPKFMVRKGDGMVMAFNQDVWDVDQHTKKRLRCVAALPASYIQKLNAIKSKSISDEAGQREYADNFAAGVQDTQAQALRSAELSMSTLQEIGGENLVAEGLVADHVADAPAAFILSTASKEDLLAYAEDELAIQLDPSLSEDVLRREVAAMMGVEVPTDIAVPAKTAAAVPQARAPRRAAVRAPE